MNKTFRIFLCALVLGTMFFSWMMMASGQDDMYDETNDKVKFPWFGLYVDGTFDLDRDMLLDSNINLPQDLPLINQDNPFESVNTQERYSFVPSNAFELGIRLVERIDFDQWRVHFTRLLEAPIIDIWNDPVVNNGPSLSDNENEIPVGTKDRVVSDKKQGLESFYGDRTYLVENSTADEITSYAITTDFDVDTYNILYLEDITSLNTNNVSVTVTYTENLSYTNLNATYAYNVTVLNEFISDRVDPWFRLDLVNTNSSFDEYVTHIAFSNVDIDGGKFILNTDANTTDARYETMYIGGIDTDDVVTLSAEQHFQHKINPSLGLGLSSFWDNAEPSDILGVRADFEGLDEGVSEARGWRDEDELEDTLQQSILDIINQDAWGFSDIKDIAVDNAVTNWVSDAASNEYVKKSLDVASSVKNSVPDVVRTAAGKTYSGIKFSAGLAAKAITAPGEAAEEILDLSYSAAAAAKDNAVSWGVDVKNKITDTAGSIKDGAISIVSKAAGAIGDFAEGGLMNILILVAGVGLGILIIYFIIRRIMM